MCNLPRVDFVTNQPPYSYGYFHLRLAGAKADDKTLVGLESFLLSLFFQDLADFDFLSVIISEILR